MQKESMNNLFHGISKERVEDELLSKANLEIINNNLPKFVNYLNELEVYYSYKQGISTKLNYHITDFHIVWDHLENHQEMEEAKETLIAYKDKIEKLLDRSISWSDYGYLINEIRADFEKKHNAELLRRFLEILPKQYHQYITGAGELTESEAKQLRSGKYIIFCTYEDLDGIADGTSFNADTLEDIKEQVIDFFTE